MKVLIVSDTHRKDDNLERIIEEEAPFDMLIHLGDAEGSEYLIEDWVDKDCQLELGNHRILLTHGHYYNVSLGVEGLREEAIERGCDIAMYGHTHRPYLEQGGKVTILNPGSLSYPRQEGHRPSYMIMELDKDGTPSYHTCYLD